MKNIFIWNNEEYEIVFDYFALECDSSLLIKCGKTAVLCTITVGDEECADYAGLSVSYLEKAFAFGRIPPGFSKRETKMTDREILISRLIDRSLRPFFPSAFTKEVQLIATVLNYDNKNEPDIVAMLGSFVLVYVSTLPINVLCIASRFTVCNNEILINPQRKINCTFDGVITSSIDGLIMIDIDSPTTEYHSYKELLSKAHTNNIDLLNIVLPICEKYKKNKNTYNISITDNSKELYNFCTTYFDSMIGKSKKARKMILQDCYQEVIKNFSYLKNVTKSVGDILAVYLRNLLEEKNIRIDGRSNDEIRKISFDSGVLSNSNGSAIFTRGETSVLSVITISTLHEQQTVETIAGDQKERFFLHYNFQPYSVGEVGKVNAISRREIGHGKLATRGLLPIIPNKNILPYTIRACAEVLSCNGSSSMATVCATTLAMIDAGIEIKEYVAGISIGLLQSQNNILLLDIQSDEDFIGDMDLKVIGTKTAINTVQMDIKGKAVSIDILSNACIMAKNAINYIISEMEKYVDANKDKINKNEPKVYTLQIDKNKIKMLIGQGGKNIKEISDKNAIKIDINDNGYITICANNERTLKRTLNMIDNLIFELDVGSEYEGVVIKILDFGVFVSVKGKEGLLSISDLPQEYSENIFEYMPIGKKVIIKVEGTDNKGKSKFSLISIC